MPETAELTIDELARETGLTARNIRAHQSRGLLPPPEVRSRTGYYGPEHVDRLRRIRELQDEGFNLKAIERLLDLSEAGLDEAIRFQQELMGAFGSNGNGERDQVISPDELASRFGGPLDERLVSRAEQTGALRRRADGEIEILNPTLVRAAQELVELGIPLRHALAVGQAVADHAGAISREFVRLFVQDVLGPLEKRGTADAEEWIRARDALERLRPLAGEAVAAAFQQAMAAAVEREVARRVRS